MASLVKAKSPIGKLSFAKLIRINYKFSNLTADNLHLYKILVFINGDLILYLNILIDKTKPIMIRHS
tara:strand:+ start:395 stop:595 length:201 start_codon:yes stop_codon:yes gene_type:complete